MEPDERAWLKKNLGAVVAQTNLIAGAVRWGGRWTYGESVPANTLVVYDARVFLSLGERSNEPAEGADGWLFLCSLRSMRFPLKPVVPGPWSLDERAAALLIESPFLLEVVNKAAVEAQEGMSQWLGLWRWERSYQPGDIIVFNHGIFQTLTGEGTPGYNTLGWQILDWVVVSMQDLPGAIVHDKGTNPKYRIFHDGIRVVHRMDA